MLDTARKAVKKLDGKIRADFDADENLRLALAYLIQIIGEAASPVSPSFREAHTDIPWSEIVGMRHKIVHDYLRVDLGQRYVQGQGDPRACRRALRIRSGVIGWRVRRTPNGASASFTAFRMAPGAPAVPASAIPLNPPTVNGDGVSR
jgi:hypothetical protein